MKKSIIKLIVLTTIGICFFGFALSPIINNNFEVEIGDRYNENLKTLKISGPIHIDDNNPSINWSVAKSAGICTGNGTYSNPYVIEDLVINAGGSGNGIWIENSDVYFIIENCTLFNSGGGTYYAGIKLVYVKNSQLTNNK